MYIYICITVFVRMRLCVFIDEALLQIFHLRMVTRVRPPARSIHRQHPGHDLLSSHPQELHHVARLLGAAGGASRARQLACSCSPRPHQLTTRSPPRPSPAGCGALVLHDVLLPRGGQRRQVHGDRLLQGGAQLPVGHAANVLEVLLASKCRARGRRGVPDRR